jgi:transcriptional regulator with XRE-family HTH domain
VTRSFAQLLADALAARRLSQTKLARRVPCSPTTIQKYLRGEMAPTRATLGALVGALRELSPLEERRLYHALGYATPAELASDLILIDPPDIGALERERIPAGLV